ncbi:unnamed protein product [Caenorhabditis sp. 36 PRJEB53466]|nr:unnamed protein product [Caenorhabditis sp. 36 PRJEB53466]
MKMRFLGYGVWLSLILYLTSVNAGGLFNFRYEALENFNGARRLLGSGQLTTMISVINKAPIGSKLKLPDIGPAANMYKLKWSRKLEQEAFLYMKEQSMIPEKGVFKSFEHNGYIAFTWPGELMAIVEKLLGAIPIKQVVEALKAVMNALNQLLMALLLAWNYPKTLPVADDVNLGATEALFAHRFEIGCYADILYSTCLMSKSRADGYLYKRGVPCSECPTHCEFFEHSDGFVEEGDLSKMSEELGRGRRNKGNRLREIVQAELAAKNWNSDEEDEQSEDIDFTRKKSRRSKPTPHRIGGKFARIEPKIEEIEEIEEQKPTALLNNDEPLSTILKNPPVSEHFTKEESLAVVRFVLDEIRSKTEGREGRVAKRRAQPKSMQFWARFARQYEHARRKPVAYSEHFGRCLKYLDKTPFLTLEEKVDLYYSLDVPVHKSLRTAFVDLFEVKYNEEWVITGSTVLDHWDYVHPDSDREDHSVSPMPSVFLRGGSSKSKTGEFRGLRRFTEKEDGVMWQFVLDCVNRKAAHLFKSYHSWRGFRKAHLDIKEIPDRTSDVFRTRFEKILIPNLHRMPFDPETKAAIYQDLGLQVPEEFRATLTQEAGVSLSEDGAVIANPNRPDFLVLQSKPIESAIGLTSAARNSTLKQPHFGHTDSVPYTDDENQAIWEYLLERHCDERGRPIRYVGKTNGYKLWKHYVRDVQTERSWQSLSRHFAESLTKNIMSTDFDIVTKLRLYFIFNVPVDAEALKCFDTICSILSRNSEGCIRYAIGLTFEFGNKNLASCSAVGHTASEDTDEEKNATEHGEVVVKNSVDHPYIRWPPSNNWKANRSDRGKSSSLETNSDSAPPAKMGRFERSSEEPSDVQHYDFSREMSLGDVKQEEPEVELIQPKLEKGQPSDSLEARIAEILQNSSKEVDSGEPAKRQTKPREYTARSRKYWFPRPAKQPEPIDSGDMFKMIQKTFGEEQKSAWATETLMGGSKRILKEDSAQKLRLVKKPTESSSSPEPSTSAAVPVRYVVPTPAVQRPLDIVFDQMEIHIKEFCRKLREASLTMTAAQRVHYANRATSMLRTFRICTRDVLNPGGASIVLDLDDSRPPPFIRRT